MPYQGMLAETTTVQGHGGDAISAYFARPLGPGPHPSVVLIHHAPGWDEWYFEATRKFAHHGYVAICPNLYHRAGEGSSDDVAARVRAAGGVPDDQVVGDGEGSINYVRSLSYVNGKVGIIGSCSGGRHTYVVACKTKGLDAAVDLWGGGVVMPKQDLTPKRPVSPIDLTKDLSCPLLGLFGQDDKNPSPEQVTLHEQELKKHGKTYEFHTYPNAGHGFFYYDRPMYRLEQALDGWKKVFAFFSKHLSAPAK